MVIYSANKVNGKEALSQDKHLMKAILHQAKVAINHRIKVMKQWQ